MNEVNLGPISTLLNDPAITEVMINRFDQIFVEKSGQITQVQGAFSDEEELQNLILQIANECGQEIHREKPYMDAFLPDGSRINAVVPPMAPKGANLTIRKFSPTPYTMQDLIRIGTVPDKCAAFLDICVKARLNIVVSGGTGTGKTTFLNVLSQLIPANERLITIEDTPELQLSHPNWIRLLSVRATGGYPGATIRDCVVNALRMRPDRILVGECRKDEAFEMLQAMNTGHDGSLTSIHANNPRDCLSRIESLVCTNVEYPITALRKQIVSAIDLIIQLKRTRDGERMITEITELTGMESDTITTQSIFKIAKDEMLYSTGIVPGFVTKLTELGYRFPQGFFDPNTQLGGGQK